MARITNEDAEKYFSGGSSEWFQLKNDGDVARVQFMFDSIDEIPMFSTHRVKVGDKERYVDCLRAPHDPIEKCPFCASGMPAKATRFVVMYQHDDQKVKIWERGRQFISKLQGLINRYSPLGDHVFEIERHGKAGDTSTKYEIYPLDNVEAVDIFTLEQPDLEGGLVLQKSFEDMEEYLDTGNFPMTEGESTSSVRRRGATDTPAGYTPRRQTPATPAASTRRGQRAPQAQDSVSEEAPTPRRGSRRGSTPEETF